MVHRKKKIIKRWCLPKEYETEVFANFEYFGYVHFEVKFL